MPPFVGVAVKVTEAALHIGLLPVVIAIVTEGATAAERLIVIAALVAVAGEGQVADDVNTTLIKSPFTKLVPAEPV